MQKGSIVVCINDNFTADNITMFNKMPVKGELYMIREVMIGDHAREELGVTLEDIYGKIIKYSYKGVSKEVEYHFVMHRFKEVLPPIEIKVAELNEIVETMDICLSR